MADPGFGGRGGGVNCHTQGRSPCPRNEVPSVGRIRERKLKSGNAYMTSEVLKNPYFVRLYCL